MVRPRVVLVATATMVVATATIGIRRCLVGADARSAWRQLFGSPVDITLSELAIEAFLPANPQTADAMRALLAPAS